MTRDLFYHLDGSITGDGTLDASFPGTGAFERSDAAAGM
jgi:hypothetical protein